MPRYEKNDPADTGRKREDRRGGFLLGPVDVQHRHPRRGRDPWPDQVTGCGGVRDHPLRGPGHDGSGGARGDQE